MTHNLALLPKAERQAMHADRVATHLRSKCKKMGMAAWRDMCRAELDKMAPADADAVKEQLGKRAKMKMGAGK